MSDKLIIRRGSAPARPSAFLSTERTPGEFKDIEFAPKGVVWMAEDLLHRIQVGVRPQVLWTLTTHPDYHEYIMRWSGPGGDVQLRMMVSVYGVNLWLHDRHGSVHQLCGTTPLASWTLTRRVADDVWYGSLEVCRFGGNNAMDVTPLTFAHPVIVEVEVSPDGSSAKAELGADVVSTVQKWIREAGVAGA